MAHAEQIFRDLLKDIAIDQNFTNYNLKVTPISTGGANYTSKLFLATISEGSKEINVFAKVAAIGEKMRAQFPMQLYDIERFFYKRLAKRFRRLEEKGVSKEEKFRIPIFYGSNDKQYEETIVLDNLTLKGFKSYDRFKGVTWQYAASAITELAKFHALSVAYKADDPEEFDKVLKEEVKFEMGEDEQMMAVWEGIVQKAVDATKEENKERLKKFFRTTFDVKDTFKEWLAPGKLPIITHGDYRPSNLMHRELEDGSVEVIPVDYQTLRGGCPVIDLLYFIFTGTDKQFRAQYYDKLIDHYYTELSAALTRLGLNPNVTYSREDYDSELKEKLPFGLGIAVFTLPIVTVEAENAPTVDENMDLSSFSIEKTGSLFPERLNGVVDDYVRWGVI